MRCYYHEDREAVGICKNCYRALCRDCAVDVGDGLACPGACEGKVRESNEMVQKGIRNIRMGKSNLRWSVFFNAAMGLLFIVFGLILRNLGSYSYFMLAFGALMLAIAGRNYIVQKKKM